MPGGINSNFYGGAQGEYLAQYLLSIIGSAVVVPRQIDDGKDFHCSVGREEGAMLHFDFPFLIQIKTISDSTLTTADIIFGTKSESGTWRKYEIDWLSKQRLPLFFGIISKNENSLKIYSTSTMWFVFHHHENPSQIKLTCRLDGSAHDVGGTEKKAIVNWPNDSGDGYEHSVDLGPPVMTIDVNSVWDKDYLSVQKNNLTSAIEIEQINILYRRLGIPYFTWLLNISQNRAGIFYPSAETGQEASKHLSNILFATATRYRANGEAEKLNHIKLLIKLLPRDHFPMVNTATSKDLKETINFLFDENH
jgi:hypothetical protein